MKKIQTTKKSILHTILILTMILQGCGGGSSDSSDATNNNDFTPIVTQTGIIAFDEESKIAQPVELFLYYPNDTLSNITWQQNSV